MRIKEQLGEKWSIACTHSHADCLLTNTSTKHNNYVVNRKLEHVEDNCEKHIPATEFQTFLYFRKYWAFENEVRLSVGLRIKRWKRTLILHKICFPTYKVKTTCRI